MARQAPNQTRSQSHELQTANAHHRAGRLDLAIPIYRAIAAADTRNGEALKMLAIALFQTGAAGEAEQFARRAASLKPHAVDGANILASIVGQLGRYTEAVEVLRPLESRLANFPGACLTYGLALRGLRDYAAAAIWFARAIERDPALPDVYLNYGFVLAELGRRDEAAAALRNAVARAPNSAPARHMLACLDGSNPDAPPIEYVRGLFDEYAPRFERELVGDLGYRVPETLRQLIETGAGNKLFTRALDLGCGTGLSGRAIKDRVVELIGVDVARAMIAEARAKNIYSSLFSMEIGAYLASNDALRKPFDLVIAADVFIYVGKLDAIFEALARRMAPKGLFAFSIESSESAPFILRESGRYAHSIGYIERLAADHGFGILAREAITIRKAKDGHVAGFAFLLEWAE